MIAWVVVLLAVPAARPAGAEDLVDLVKRVEPAVVRVDTDRGLGSGVIVDNRGYVFTNYHVIDGAAEAAITLRSGEKMPVRGYLAVDPSRDLALLKIDKLPKPTALSLAAALPQTGQRVAAFGNPEGFTFSTSEGIVSAVRSGREVSQIIGEEMYRALGYGADATWVQTTADISHGNSGGPLVSMDGRIVGLNTWGHPEGQNLNFAIGVPDLKVLLDRAVETSVSPLAGLPRTARPRVPRDDSPRGNFQVELPSGRVFMFSIFDTTDHMTRLADRDNDDSVCLITHPGGALYAVAMHDKGVLNGVTLAQYDNKQPMAYVTYLDGRRHGVLKTWDEGGRPQLFAQYAKGKRHGFYCVFGSGKSWMLMEYKFDAPLSMQIFSGYRPLEHFTSREKAEAHPAARELLAKADKLETTLKTNEVAFRKQVSAFEQELRRARAAELGPQKRARIQERINQRGAQESAFLREMFRRSYGR
jgi:S1-C subfamily serine protease